MKAEFEYSLMVLRRLFLLFDPESDVRICLSVKVQSSTALITRDAFLCLFLKTEADAIVFIKMVRFIVHII